MVRLLGYKNNTDIPILGIINCYYRNIDSLHYKNSNLIRYKYSIEYFIKNNMLHFKKIY